MAITPPEFELIRARVGLASAAYDDDTVRLASRSLAGATHLVASRKGLYAVSEREWSLVAHGFFFGISFRDGDIYVFEACDEPRSLSRKGRIVRFKREGDTIASAAVVAKGLDNGCHQIDFIGDRLHVVDTYNQMLLRFDSSVSSSYETLTPLSVAAVGRWSSHDAAYAHVNSILQVGDQTLLLLHNGSEHTGRASEIAVYNRSGWQPLARWQLQGRSCHSLALLEDGTLLTCDSMAGDLIGANGLRVCVSQLMTRGLAVGTDTVAVGASRRANREQRLGTSGTVTFMDRNYRIRSVLELPGAPTEVRRLDAQDAGLSSYLERMPWAQALQAPTPAL